MASKEYVTLLTERYPQLKPIGDQIEAAYKILETCYEQGGKLLIAGNGGSCADAEHIVGELMKGFVKRRRVSKEEQALLEQGLKTVALTGRDGGKLAKSADAAIIVPEQETYKIQELHLPIYHALCLMLEEHFFEL